MLNDIWKYLHNTPLSDSLPLVRVFWGCRDTPSNGGLKNTLLGVVEEVDIQAPQTAVLKHPIFNSVDLFVRMDER